MQLYNPIVQPAILKNHKVGKEQWNRSIATSKNFSDQYTSESQTERNVSSKQSSMAE